MVYLKSVENVITLGKLIGLLFLFCLPLLSLLFLKTKRNDLARPVMGTIFLVYTADTLSRAPRSIVDNDQTVEEETECIMEVTVNSLQATQKSLQEYGKAQASDSVCSTIVKYCQIGWPDKHKIEPHLKVLWKNRELTANQGLLLYGRCIVVPSTLRTETLQKIHDGHQGIVRCRLRARSSVWWPGIMTHIKDLVEKCSICALKRKPPQ